MPFVAYRPSAYPRQRYRIHMGMLQRTQTWWGDDLVPIPGTKCRKYLEQTSPPSR